GAARKLPWWSHPHPPPRPHAGGRRLGTGPTHRADEPARGTVRRVRSWLAPLPSEVAGTCRSRSRPGSCFPPEVRNHTDCLCSAGSEVPPRSPASSLVCSPPTPLWRGPRLRLPLPRPTSRTDAYSEPAGRASVDAQRVGGLEAGPPSPRPHPRTSRGLPGYWVALFTRAVVVHPASGGAASPVTGDTSCCLQGW